MTALQKSDTTDRDVVWHIVGEGYANLLVVNLVGHPGRENVGLGLSSIHPSPTTFQGTWSSCSALSPSCIPCKMGFVLVTSQDILRVNEMIGKALVST